VKTSRNSADVSRRGISRTAALVVVLLLWAAYTTLQTLFVTGDISETWSAILAFLPGVIGVAVLLAAGRSRADLFLRIAPLSRGGLVVLIVIAVVGLAVVVPFGTWQGWNWTAALLYAPASGVSQELFFRAALLPALLWVLKQRPRLALILHAVLFGLWHIGPFFVGAPIWAGVAVVMVPLLCGVGWGWQVQHDRTVLWAMVQHSLIWVIGLQFPM